MVLEAFLSLALLPLSLCNLLFPFVYKRGSRMPHGRGGWYTTLGDMAVHHSTRL